MDSSELYLVTLLVLIMTSLPREESASAQDRREAVHIENNCKAGDPILPYPISLESRAWNEHTGWYQNGQSWLPNKDGCGGIINATENYQYGILTSPNWPHALPSQARCEWFFHDFESLFFVVNGRFSNKESEKPGTLTVKIHGQSQPMETITLGGDYLHQKYFLNVSRQIISLILTTNFTPDINFRSQGARLTWWTVPEPNPAFVKIVPSRQGLKFPIEFPLTLQERKSTAYVFIFKDPLSTYEAEIGLTVLDNETVIPCSDQNVSMYTIRYDQNVKLLCTTSCNSTSGHLKLDVLGHNQLEATPLGIEFSIPEGISLVNISINVFPKDSLLPSRSKDVSVQLQGEWKDCESFGLKKEGDVAFFRTQQFNDTNNTSVKYNKGVRCDPQSNVHAPILDSFIQVQTQTDIQVSPSCVADFLLVGGQRVCGVNGPDTYISSPVDNSLIERTATYYSNILKSTNPVFSGSPVKSKSKYPAGPSFGPNECYVGFHPGDFNYWLVDLVDVFQVKGVKIVTRSINLTNAAILVFVRNEGDTTFPLSYQKCWNGSLPNYHGRVICTEQVSGRYLLLTGGSFGVSLCSMEVLVNIAAPLAAWRNAAYRKTAYNSTGTGTSYDSLVDGDPVTCVLHKLPARLFYVFHLGHRKIVQAVRLYFMSAAQKIQFRVFFEASNTCASYKGQNEQHIGILLSCAEPTLTDTVNLGNLVNVNKVCEVIVYADFNDKSSTNAALHKDAILSLMNTSQLSHVPAIVDGDPLSCEHTDYAFFVDLHGFHIVEGVLLNLGDDQQKTDQVEVWVSPFDTVVEPTLDSDCLCHGKAYTDSYKLKLLCSLPRVGKHVILEISGPGKPFLHLCEVQVIAVPYDKDRGLQNVALFKHAQQGPQGIQPTGRDSPQVFYRGHGARLAVDGDRRQDTPRLTCTEVLVDGNSEAWWEVDLANMFRVTAVGLFLCSKVNHSYVLYISVSDGRPNSNQWCYSGPPENLVNCSQAMWGRYVRLKSNWSMCLCEVEVMAKPLITYERFGERPQPIQSSTSNSIFALLEFVTDGYIEERGFSALYRADNLKNFNSLVDCGNLVREHNATLFSPNYPDVYAFSNESYICHWMVYTPYDSFTSVNIFLNLTQPVSQTGCFHDVLIISNSAGQQITKCGYINDETVNMKSYKNEYLHVTLMVRKYETQANETVPRRGGMMLRFLSYAPCTYRLIKVEPNRTETLATPFYPGEPPYVWCRWILVAMTMGSMHFSFLEWDFQHVPRNGCDTELLIKRRDRGYTFCAKDYLPDDLKIGTQTGERVTIVFKSKRNVIGRGFLLQYHFPPYAHNYELGYNRTIIESLRYPESNDPENVTLTWTISSRAYGTIEIKFDALEIWPVDDVGIGSGVFKVISSVILDDSEPYVIETTIKRREPEQALFIPVYPNTVFSLVFVPTEGGSNAAKFRILYRYITELPKWNFTRAYVAETDSVQEMDKNPEIRFTVTNLQEDMGRFVYDYRLVFVPWHGLYVVSIRIIPRKDSLQSSSTLRVNVNNKESPLIAYGTLGQIGSVTAVLKLKKGDMLSVLADPDKTYIDQYSTFSFVFASPVKDGTAFTGYLGDVKLASESDRVLLFDDSFLSIGLPPSYFPNGYHAFTAPKPGIYWVSLRPVPHPTSNTDVIKVLLSGQSSFNFLESLCYGSVPGSVSAAFYFKKEENITVFVIGGATGKQSLLSLVHLDYRTYSNPLKDFAFTGQVDECRRINSSGATLSFYMIQINLGGMMKDPNTFMVPIEGLYIISIRIDVPRTSCDGSPLESEQVLHVSVNGHLKVTAYARSNPTGHVSVLRLKANDTLTVTAMEGSTVGKGTLFSIAYIHSEFTNDMLGP